MNRRQSAAVNSAIRHLELRDDRLVLIPGRLDISDREMQSSLHRGRVPDKYRRIIEKAESLGMLMTGIRNERLQGTTIVFEVV